MQTQVIRGWIVGILAVFAIVVGVSPAGAHAELESSDPKDGATLSSAPAAISFVFGEEILPEGNAVTLTDVAADTRLEVGPVEVEGDTVSVAWPTGQPCRGVPGGLPRRLSRRPSHRRDDHLHGGAGRGGCGGEPGRGVGQPPGRRVRKPGRGQPLGGRGQSRSRRRGMRMPGC